MITICLALVLYHGPIEPLTPTTVLSEVCERVEDPWTVLDTCEAMGAQRCEWLVTGRTLTVELKGSTVDLEGSTDSSDDSDNDRIDADPVDVVTT